MRSGTRPVKVGSQWRNTVVHNDRCELTNLADVFRTDRRRSRRLPEIAIGLPIRALLAGAVQSRIKQQGDMRQLNRLTDGTSNAAHRATKRCCGHSNLTGTEAYCVLAQSLEAFVTNKVD